MDIDCDGERRFFVHHGEFVFSRGWLKFVELATLKLFDGKYLVDGDRRFTCPPAKRKPLFTCSPTERVIDGTSAGIGPF